VSTFKTTQQVIDYAISLYSSGNFNEAIIDIEKLIRDNPNESKLFNIKGACYYAIGDFDSAVDNFMHSIALNSDYAEAHFNLGGVQQDLEQSHEAILSYQRAITIKPNYPEALNNLGGVFNKLLQFSDAIESYKQALRVKPTYVEAHFALALSYQDTGQLNEAFEHFKKTTELKPNFAEAHNNLGKILISTGNFGSAINYFNNAIELLPNFYEAHNNLGTALQGLGQLDGAVKSYQNAILLNPNYLEPNYNLGLAFQELGNVESSIVSYEKVLNINPNYPEAYHNLSYLKKYSKNDPQIATMHSLLLTKELENSDRIFLCLALANIYENLDDKINFFKFLNEGNRLFKVDLNYSIEESFHQFSAIKDLFNTYDKNNEEPKQTDPSEKQPIFIVGMPRSGTTLLEQIVSSHQKVYGGGELDTLTNLINPIIKNYMSGEIKLLDKELISFIRQEYLHILSSFNVSEKIITDKLPLNFQYIGFILSAFPEAKIVHIKRDPVATCWSNYSCTFTSRANGYSYNFDDLSQFYYLYEDLMDFWQQLYPGKIHKINYEELTTNQEEETRKLLAYCNLDWDENCLNFHANKRAVQTASSLQVREKMYQGSSEVWKKYRNHLQPLLDSMKLYKNTHKTR